MTSYNRGEWSEFYGILFLLVKPSLKIVDANFNILNEQIYTVEEIILQSKIQLSYVIDNNSNSIIIYLSGEEYNRHSFKTVECEKNRLLKLINNVRTKEGAFSLEAFQPFLDTMTGGYSFKGKSGSKEDIITITYDNLKRGKFELSYSIKSMLGSPATILNSSSNTNFIYKIKDFPRSDIGYINSIDTRTKLLDRIHAINHYQEAEIEFVGMESEVFDHNLRMIDTQLPIYLANALLYSYEFNEKGLEQAFKLSNPNLPNSIAEKKLTDFLNGISFGFVPGKVWDGTYSVNGGLIVVKADGDVVVLDLAYYENEVGKYIMKESKFDSPSTSRYHMLELYEEKGEVYFSLNLQVRYK